MSTLDRLPNKEARRAHALLTSLGYRFDRISKGAWVYVHSAAAPYHLHCTTHKYGHAAFRRVLCDMTLRHPDKIRRANASKPRAGISRTKERDRAAAEAKARVRAAERQLAEPPLPYDGCPVCGYRWRSDRNPAGQPCPEPHCDGVVIVGVKAQEAPAVRRVRQPWEPRVA